MVAPTDLPPHLIQAFIASEDSRFFQHGGLDFLSILRAVWKNIWAGEIVQGGSTITQQVTKSLLLSPEKSFSRKIKEAFLAYRLDQNLSKRDILFIYLNQIYLGHGAYGVEAAAQTYFGKKSKELTLAESAMLAGLPQAPSRYSPFMNFQRAKERQRYVLKRMVEEGYLSSWQAQTAEQLPLYFARGSDSMAPWPPISATWSANFYIRTTGRILSCKPGSPFGPPSKRDFKKPPGKRWRTGPGRYTCATYIPNRFGKSPPTRSRPTASS